MKMQSTRLAHSVPRNRRVITLSAEFVADELKHIQPMKLDTYQHSRTANHQEAVLCG